MKKYLLAVAVAVSSMTGSVLAEETKCINNLFEGTAEGGGTKVIICELDNHKFRFEVSDNITHTGVVYVDVDKKNVSYSSEKDGDTVTNELFLEEDEVFYGIAVGVDENKDAYAVATVASGGELKQTYELDPKTVKHSIGPALHEQGFKEELPD